MERERGCPIVVLISLEIDGAEHLPLCLCAFHVSLVKCQSRSLAYFLIGSFIFGPFFDWFVYLLSNEF